MPRLYSARTCLSAALLVLVAALPAKSQDADSKALYPILIENKWGLISERGEVVAPATYDSIKGLWSPVPGCMDLRNTPNVLGADGPVVVGRHSGTRAIAWGFVGPKGEVVPPTYSEVYGFQDGIAAVSKREKWGFIDVTGAEVIPFKYDYASGFREGASAVMIDGWWGLIDREGRYVVELKYDVIRPLTHGPYFMFEEKGLQGVIDANGEVLVDPQFDQVHVLSEGLVNVYVGGKGGYYNTVTKAIEIEPQFDMAAPFNYGVAEVRIGKATGFIDRNGNFTVELREPDKRFPSSFGHFSSDWPKLSPVRKYVEIKRGHQKVGLIDVRDGTILIEPMFDSIGMVYGGRAVLQDGRNYGYLDADGKIAIPAQYQQASDFSGGLAYVQFRGGSGYIDLKGHLVIKFDDKRVLGGPFRPNLALVYGDGRDRYVDHSGQEIFSFQSSCR